MIKVRIRRVPMRVAEEVLARIWVMLERYDFPSPMVEIEATCRSRIDVGVVFCGYAPGKLILDTVRPWLETADVAILPDGHIVQPTNGAGLVDRPDVRRGEMPAWAAQEAVRASEGNFLRRRLRR